LPPGPQDATLRSGFATKHETPGKNFFVIEIPGDFVPWWLIFFRKICNKNEMDNPDGVISTVLFIM